MTGRNSYGPALLARIDALAELTDEPGRLTRLYLSPAHAAARDRVAGWMAAAGLAVRVDALGTVIGRREGASPGLPAVMLGSHIDTVRDAGRYDGNLGVLAALAAVEALGSQAGALPFALEVVAFGDEENVRFPTALLSSRALAGDVAEDELDAADADGVTVREALLAQGLDPAGLPSAARPAGDLLAYVEMHIEQGPVLEAEGLPLGVVTAISGRIRLDVTVTGVAGHAGTVPMGLRRDALAGAAEMVTAIERIVASEEGLVATVGTLAVAPGASNVIPGEARFTIDLRAADDRRRDRMAGQLRAVMGEIADRRGLALAIREPYRQPATAMDRALVDMLAAAVEDLGLPARRLDSGAGHDAMAMARRFPTGMLFLRCAGGISHHPAESITEDDADIAVRALLAVIARLAAAHA